jgi:hypothetical protein
MDIWEIKFATRDEPDSRISFPNSPVTTAHNSAMKDEQIPVLIANKQSNTRSYLQEILPPLAKLP